MTLSKGTKTEKKQDQVSMKQKFKMEVDLSSLHGKVHFADDEKFQIPSHRAHDMSAQSNDNMRFISNATGGVSSYISQKKGAVSR